MSLPASINTSLIHDFDIEVASSSSISGGSINRACRIETNRGMRFLKYNENAPADFFEKEADGLELLRSSAAGNLHVPEVTGFRAPDGDCPGFLVMEYINTGSNGNAEKFGAALAKLHQTEAEQFGLSADNYIGSLPQSNLQHDSWTAFFIEERINPQLKMAVDSGKMSPSDEKNWEILSGKLESVMPETVPSLVHGDLWGGNYLFDADGQAVLIDPAIYYGHPEMDLAFSKMFGGFSPGFYRGYESVTKLDPGFEDRVPVYNLYPLLVHVNLFGGHYVAQARRVLSRFS